MNVSNDVSSRPEEFSPKDIEVLVDSSGGGGGGGWRGWGGGNWFKRAHVRRFLGLIQSEKLLVGLDKCEMLARKDIQPTVNQPCP